MVLVVFYFYDWAPIVYNNKEPYPVWAENVGIALVAIPIISIPLAALVRICASKVRLSFCKWILQAGSRVVSPGGRRFKKLTLSFQSITEPFRPHKSWGPANGTLLEEYENFKNYKKSPIVSPARCSVH